MKLHKPFAISLMVCLFGAAIPVQAADGNWKKGRIYYRMVCTACHKDHAGGSISPATMTKAEWKAYIAADQHAKGKDTLSYYVSQEYRNSIKDTNKAAAKFAKVPNDEMMADVQAFVIHGAKDSDTPARCN
ncbi:MAG: c-type cytochrome [Gammaproteobacteria bacterium]|jgi:cytochrome c5|nr:c-type cytochrome [Gammaproteobacteria bacterium]